MSRFRCLVASLFVCVLLAPGLFAQSDFTIVALPDTQYYAKTYPSIFKAQTQWIASNATALNIQVVLGLGDVVDNPNFSSQLTNADAAYDILDAAKIPYFAAIGNHDYYNGGASAIGLKRDAHAWNQYFGPARYTNKSYYRGNYGGSNENFWGTITLGGQTYLILALEFYPRAALVAWASNILDQNSSLPAIVVTHSQLVRNAHITTCDNYAKEDYGLFESNDGEDLWNNLLSQHANIQLVLSGHVTDGSGVARVADLGVNGNLVNQIMSDYQSFKNGGNGYLRIMKFHPAQNTIEVSTYSPYDGTSLTDSANQFVVPIVATPSGGTATIKGTVKERDQCAVLSGANVSDDQGHATVTDSKGNFTLSGVTPGAVTVHASADGRVTGTRSFRVNGGYTYTAKFALTLAP